jgi:hypothetical protein
LRRLAAIFLCLAFVAAAQPRHPVAEIKRIEARLFYIDRGVLSSDVLHTDGQFSNWNMIIGEGESGPATDVLIVVAVDQMRPEGSDALVSKPLKISATRAGKVIASRVVNPILVPPGGPGYAALWLKDVGCAGRVLIKAQLAGRMKTATLDLRCGE